MSSEPSSPVLFARLLRRAALFACVLAVVIAGQQTGNAQAPTEPNCAQAYTATDFHFPREMQKEDGSRAFSYGIEGIPFVSMTGDVLTFAVRLNFEPGADAAIKVGSLDVKCSGGNSSGAVFEYSFGELKSTALTLSYNITTGAITINGETAVAVPAGTPRYLWIEVWDGEAGATRAGYSSLVDLLHPLSPVSQ